MAGGTGRDSRRLTETHAPRGPGGHKGRVQLGTYSLDVGDGT